MNIPSLPIAFGEPRASPAQGETILLVTTQPLFRAALCWALQQIRPEGDIIEVSSLSAAVKHLQTEPCSLVLFDGNPDDGNAFEVLKTLKADFRIPVAILASSAHPTAARRAFDHGVCGYLSRTEPLEQIARTICNLAKRSLPARARRQASNDLASTDTDEALTPAQAKVLLLIEKGQLNKQIAYELSIAESTVKAHVSAIFRKLKVQNRVQATLVASRHYTRAGHDGTEVGLNRSSPAIFA